MLSARYLFNASKAKKMAKQQNIPSLIVEMKNGKFWGRTTVNGTLLIEVGRNLTALKKALKKLVYNFENVIVDDFEISYDLTSFFEVYTYLNITDIAKRANINPGLMRQYAAGVKFPSADRVSLIQTAIREIGKELARVRLHKPQAEQA